MPTKIHHKSHYLWGKRAKLPKNQSFPQIMHFLGFSFMWCFIRYEAFRTSSFTISMIKFAAKLIKIEFGVIILKSPIFDQKFHPVIDFYVSWLTEFSFHKFLMITEKISHIFCIIRRWNGQNRAILTMSNLRLKILRFHAHGFSNV